MPHQRSLEAEWWFEAVYQAVQEVPAGKVTSYGHIAMLLGERKDDIILWLVNCEGDNGTLTAEGDNAELDFLNTTLPKRSRQVGVCLKHLPAHNDGASHRYHDANVPWQRIINSKGQISPRGPGSAQRQATALRRERVTVTRNAMGEHCIDLSVYGWFPAYLPSQQAEGEDETETEDEEEDEGVQNEGGADGGERNAGDADNVRNASETAEVSRNRGVGNRRRSRRPQVSV